MSFEMLYIAFLYLKHKIKIMDKMQYLVKDKMHILNAMSLWIKLSKMKKTKMSLRTHVLN